MHNISYGRLFFWLHGKLLMCLYYECQQFCLCLPQKCRINNLFASTIAESLAYYANQTITVFSDPKLQFKIIDEIWKCSQIYRANEQDESKRKAIKTDTNCKRNVEEKRKNQCHTDILGYFTLLINKKKWQRILKCTKKEKRTCEAC